MVLKAALKGSFPLITKSTRKLAPDTLYDCRNFVVDIQSFFSHGLTFNKRCLTLWFAILRLADADSGSLRTLDDNSNVRGGGIELFTLLNLRYFLSNDKFCGITYKVCFGSI